jgi:hypothetical protein
MRSMSGSRRHPRVTLLDTIAMKLLMLANPGAAISPPDMERAREIVNDLAEYIGTEARHG